MIKVSVMYPYAAGARFDHAYYRERHMPMVKKRLGAACLYYTVDKGIAGSTPGTDPVYVARCDFFCTSFEAFQTARDPHAQEIRGDIANYTDIQPVLQSVRWSWSVQKSDRARSPILSTGNAAGATLPR